MVDSDYVTSVVLRKDHKYNRLGYLFHTYHRNEEKEGLIFSIKIERIRVKIGERGMICSFICMLDLVMFEFDIIPCIVSDWKYLVIF